MNYVEIVARQTEIENEMMKGQEELQKLQQDRIACAQKHEDLVVNQKLSSGSSVHIDLDYAEKQETIFTYIDGENVIKFSPEDYNEMSQFFSKYNDAIFSYMTEISKVEEDDKETDEE